MYYITVQDQHVTSIMQGSDPVEGCIEITAEQYQSIDFHYSYDYIDGELQKTTPLEEEISPYELNKQTAKDVLLTTELQLLSQEKVEAVGVDNLTNTDLIMMVLDQQVLILENQKKIMNHLGLK